MSDQDFKRHMDLVKKIQKKQFTKEEALRSLVMAGILNWNGKFTDNYPYLQAWDAKQKANKKCTASDQI